MSISMSVYFTYINIERRLSKIDKIDISIEIEIKMEIEIDREIEIEAEAEIEIITERQR